jgi:tetratricopeptide (TPR) repeat protein
VHALVNVGAVRALAGDAAGIDELEESVALARQLNSPELPRCLNNLGVALGAFGRVREADAAIETAVAAAEHFGLGAIGRFSRANRSGDLHRAGRWDEALAEAEAVLTEARTLGLHGVERIGLQVRSVIRIARGDGRGADADTARMLEIAQAAFDPQARLPALAGRIGVLVQTARLAEATALAEEALALSASVSLPFPGGTEASFVARCVGVDRWLATLAARTPWRTPWHEAIEALLRGSPDRAAELYAALPSPKDEAFARLEAGKRHLASGDDDAARAQLEAALAFYRDVRAEPYVAEAESLLGRRAAAADVRRSP